MWSLGTFNFFGVNNVFQFLPNWFPHAREEYFPTFTYWCYWRIKQSAAAFSKLHQRIWKKRHIALKTKIRTYKTMIVPCMIYSSESWNCTKKEIRKLEGLQYRQLRSIFGKTWKDRISHVQLLQSIKFGPNFNFNWAVSDDDKTKDPNLSSVKTMIWLSRL